MMNKKKTNIIKCILCSLYYTAASTNITTI